MGRILTCQCGRKLKVPAGRRVKCNACGKVVGESAPRLSARAVGEADAGRTCALCLAGFGDAGKSVVDCDLCSTPFHGECWEENGGCAIYGCERAPAVEKEPDQVHVGAATWDDEKVCPRCRRQIKAGAVKCRHCDATFDTDKPLSQREYRYQEEANRQAGRSRKLAGGLFGASLLGCLSPIVLPLAIWWIVANRPLFRKIPGAHIALGYAAAIISIAQIFIAVMIFVFKFAIEVDVP